MEGSPRTKLVQLDDLRIGCSGWSYKDWEGPFYPKGLPAKEYLGFYSKVFSCVEIDSSFYRVPSAFMVERWGRSTPPGFKFSPKLPKKITHENKLQSVASSITYFYSMVSKFREKLGPVAVQLPPSIKLPTHLDAMEKFLPQLRPEFRHAIEFRHKSWFTPEVYRLLKEYKVAMIWSMNQYVETPPEVTSDFVYLRMVGDRELTRFDGIQRDRSADLQRWAEAIRVNAGKFDSGYVFFNNHFAGFSPESSNEFRRLLGLIEADWSPDKPEQQTLFGE